MKITEISVTPVPSYYPKELGKNAFSDNIGKQRLEWIVRARTDGGVEGVTIANRAIRQGRVEDLLELLKTTLLGREVDSLLQVQNGVVTGPGHRGSTHLPQYSMDGCPRLRSLRQNPQRLSD